MADVLEVERDIFSSPAEDRIGDRERQSDAQRTDVGREHLGLDDRVDRRVAGDDHEARHDQSEGGERAMRVLERGEYRVGEQRRANAEEDHHRSPPDTVGNASGDRADEQHDRQRHGHDPRRGRAVEPARIGKELLHVDRVRVESRRAAGGEGHDQERFARMVAKKVADGRAAAVRLRRDILVAQRLVEPAPNDEGDYGEQRTRAEADAPAPGLHRVFSQRHLEKDEQGQRGQLSADDRHILEARPEAAPRLIRNLGQIGRARAIFAAEAETLDEARDQQDRRR